MCGSKTTETCSRDLSYFYFCLKYFFPECIDWLKIQAPNADLVAHENA